MKIRSIKAWRHVFALTRPYQIAYKRYDCAENVVVAIDTDQGKFGVGCGAPSLEVTGETIDASLQALQENTDWLIGRSICNFPAFKHEMSAHLSATPAACASIDIALHDLFAQSLNIALVDVFGRIHHQIPTSITIGIKNSDETLKEAQEYFSRGFRVFKVKLGISFNDDLERLYKLRETYGDAVKLRVDPNQGYRIDELISLLNNVDKLALEFIEQPLLVDDVESLNQLPAHYRPYIALDENVQTAQDALRLFSRCGIFNIKLMKCGGIFAAQKIANIADVAGINIMWGCMDESIISITAALHAALSSKATRYLDLDGSLDLAHDIVEGGFILRDGIMSLPHDKAGLGLKMLF